MCATFPDDTDRPAEEQATQKSNDQETEAGPSVQSSAGDRESVEPPEDPLEAARAEVDRVRDHLLRTAADFDNFRKRTRREISEAERSSREETLRQLLPVFDNLERAASHAETTTDVKALADGIVLVMRQFHDALARLGVERVQTVNRPFDPAVHEAIQHLETAEFVPGTVAVEVQPGYRMADRLIRPALVVVAKTPANKA